MVIKISKVASIEDVVDYNMEKVDGGLARLLDSWRIPVGSQGDDPDRQSVIQILKDRADLNHRVRKSVTHISINPSPDDRLSDEQLTEIGRLLLARLGYGDQPYLMVKHMDIERHHVHIVVSNITDNGKKISDTFEKFRCNSIRRAIEKEYSLSRAEDVGKALSVPDTDSDLPISPRTDARKPRTVTDIIRDRLDGILDGYSFSQLEDFQLLATLSGIRVAVTPSDGENSEGLAYALEGDDRTPPVAASNIGERYCMPALTGHMESRTDRLKEAARRPGLRKVLFLLNKITDMDQLQKSAASLGLTLVFRRTVQGRVYGCTVIDHKKGTVLSASKIHRDLSARNWQHLFPSRDGSSAMVVVGKSMPTVGNRQALALEGMMRGLSHPSAKVGGRMPGDGKHGGWGRPYPPAAMPGAKSGGPVSRQEQANTHFRPDDDEEDEDRRKRRRPE